MLLELLIRFVIENKAMTQIMVLNIQTYSYRFTCNILVQF